MFLFHGTRAKNLSTIFADGLIPIFEDTVANDWTKIITGKGRYDVVFLSTSPVGSLGGNPVSFALGWPRRRETLSENAPGVIVVVDIPAERLDLVLGIVPNAELDVFEQVCRVRAFWLQHTPKHTQHILVLGVFGLGLHYCIQERGISFTSERLHTLLPFQVEYRDPALPVDLTPVRWQAFVQGYFDFLESPGFAEKTIAAQDRKRLAYFQQVGPRLPDQVLTDPHARDCYTCIQKLFRYSYSLEILESSAAFHSFLGSVAHRLQIADFSPGSRAPYHISGRENEDIFKQLSFLLRLVELHVRDISSADLLRFFVQYEGSAAQEWTWEHWFKAFPRSLEHLPRIWTPGYGKLELPESLKRPDHQVMVSHIPPTYILGAISVSDSRRLLPHAHHKYGKYQPLAQTLWKMAHQMRKNYQGKPVVCHLQEYSDHER